MYKTKTIVKYFFYRNFKTVIRGWFIIVWLLQKVVYYKTITLVFIWVVKLGSNWVKYRIKGMIKLSFIIVCFIHRLILI